MVSPNLERNGCNGAMHRTEIKGMEEQAGTFRNETTELSHLSDASGLHVPGTLPHPS